MAARRIRKGPNIQVPDSLKPLGQELPSNSSDSAQEDILRDKVARLAEYCDQFKKHLEELVGAPLTQGDTAPLLKMNETQFSNVKRKNLAGMTPKWIEEQFAHADRMKEALRHLRLRNKLNEEGALDATFWVSRPVGQDRVVNHLKRKLVKKITELRASGSTDLPILYSSPVNLRAFHRAMEDVVDVFRKTDLRVELTDLFKGVVLKTIRPDFAKWLERRNLMAPYWADLVATSESIAKKAGTRFVPEKSDDSGQWIRIGSYWDSFPPIHGFYMEGKEWVADWLHVGLWTPELRSGRLMPWEVRSVIVGKGQKIYNSFRRALKEPAEDRLDLSWLAAESEMNRVGTESKTIHSMEEGKVIERHSVKRVQNSRGVEGGAVSSSPNDV